MEFDVVQGDIAAQSADALVNAANTGMRMGSGVAGALREAGGAALEESAVSKGPVDLGGVLATDAYDLDAEWVLHAASMSPGGQATGGSIRFATRNTLALAEALGCGSLVLPAIGCGVAGFGFREGVAVICEELAWHEADALADVRFIAYGDDAYADIQDVAADYR